MHFETSLVMVSHYDYDSSRWSSPFWVKMHVFSTFFNNKSKKSFWNTTTYQNLKGGSINSPPVPRWGYDWLYAYVPGLSGRGHLLAVPMRVLTLLSPLWSSYQVLDIFSLASFQEFDERKYCSRWELTTVCGPVMLLLSFVCFAIKWCFC